MAEPRTLEEQLFPELAQNLDNSEEALALHRTVSMLQGKTLNQVMAELDKANEHGLIRYLLITLHRFATAPQDDEPTLELHDRWMETAPELLGRNDLSVYERQLVEWVDIAAETYVKRLPTLQ